MKSLIAQLQTVLATSINQMNTIMESHLKVVHDRLGVHDVDFKHIAVKHSQYDAFAFQQQQRQGKGAGKAQGYVPDARSLIHEQYIKMPAFPNKHENAEVFRRCWKDVAEHCEGFDSFKGCGTLFKRVRVYEDAIQGEAAVMRFFQQDRRG